MSEQNFTNQAVEFFSIPEVQYAMIVLGLLAVISAFSLYRGVKQKFFIFNNKFDIFITLSTVVVIPVILFCLGWSAGSGEEQNKGIATLDLIAQKYSWFDPEYVVYLYMVIAVVSIVMSFLANRFRLSSIESILAKFLILLILAVGFTLNFISFLFCIFAAFLYFQQKDKRYKSKTVYTKTGQKKGLSMIGWALWCLFLGIMLLVYVVKNFCLSSCRSSVEMSSDVENDEELVKIAENS
ncbi:hypothetical protein A4G18_02905 [Pasteurellaceae bacterium Pebbles2]|nr:hypothetical protein [Pasteurellaceae bacterium Pebbles2]